MSADKIVLALDGMGGDQAPEVVVNGADIARERYPGTSYLLFGDPARLKPLVDKRKGLAKALEIVPAEDAVLAEDKPSFALRRRLDGASWLFRRDWKIGMVEQWNTLTTEDNQDIIFKCSIAPSFPFFNLPLCHYSFFPTPTSAL